MGSSFVFIIPRKFSISRGMFFVENEAAADSSTAVSIA